MRQHLRLIPAAPAPAPLVADVADRRPIPKPVPQAVRAEAENLRAKLTRALIPLTGSASTDVALSRSKRELYELATAAQHLARSLPR